MNNETTIKALIDQAIESNKKDCQDLQYVNIDLNLAEDNLQKIGESVVPGFIINHIYRDLIYYFTNHGNSEYNISKGLFIHGKTGTGKTVLANVFNIFNGVYNPPKNFRIMDASEIPIAFEIGGMLEVNRLLKGNCLLDDFGSERIEAVYYGTRAEPMKEFLIQRYKMFIQEGKLTHIITNFTMEYIKEMYGSRIESRFFEMFNDVVLDGKDLRK